MCLESFDLSLSDSALAETRGHEIYLSKQPFSLGPRIANPIRATFATTKIEAPIAEENEKKTSPASAVGLFIRKLALYNSRFATRSASERGNDY